MNRHIKRFILDKYLQPLRQSRRTVLCKIIPCTPQNFHCKFYITNHLYLYDSNLYNTNSHHTFIWIEREDV